MSNQKCYMPKVSVIITIYNAEQYIGKCAVSLFEQTLNDIEFIFIDDCSIDKSLEVLDHVLGKYPLQKNRTKIIKLSANGGTSIARSIGLQEAKGDYLIHCDSDDWMDYDFLEKLYSKAIEEDADIVIGDFIRESTNHHSLVTTDVYDTSRKMLENIHNQSFYCMLWNKLMKKKLLIDNNITFVQGINMWEDVLITLKSFYHATKIAKIEGSFYHYWVNPTSYTMNSANVKSYLQRKACIAELEKFFVDKGDWRVQLNYWRLLAKMYLLQPGSMNVQMWKAEYPDAIFDIAEMNAFSSKEKFRLKLASKSVFAFNMITLHERLLYISKQFVKNIALLCQKLQ